VVIRAEVPFIVGSAAGRVDASKGIARLPDTRVGPKTRQAMTHRH
jgi:hypothetical protein